MVKRSKADKKWSKPASEHQVVEYKTKNHKRNNLIKKACGVYNRKGFGHNYFLKDKDE